MAQDQTMNPETAAKKLGVLLAATPEPFRTAPVSRSALRALHDEPPEWLVDLRRDGPHPRSVVASRLGVSIAGLRRAEVTQPLTTEEIQVLLQQKPDWLAREREVHATVMSENARIKRERAAHFTDQAGSGDTPSGVAPERRVAESGLNDATSVVGVDHGVAEAARDHQPVDGRRDDEGDGE